MVQIIDENPGGFLNAIGGGISRGLGASAQSLPEILKLKKEQQRQDFLNQIIRKGGGQQQNPGQNLAGGVGQQGKPGQSMDQDQGEGFSSENLSDADLLALSLGGEPQAARLLQHSQDVKLRERREERKEKRESVNESYKENKEYINQSYDKYEDSLRKEAILGRMDELAPETSESGIINFLEQLGLKKEWIQNPANEEYNKLGLDLLGGGTLQADYGSRVLASEFAVSQQRIPELSQTKEGRMQISENLKAMLLPSILKEQRLQYYLNKAEQTGKPLPHNLRGKILQDIRPQLEEVYDQFKKRNGRYRVKEGTSPDDNALGKYFYLAKKDQDKAIQMMKEDGYDIE